MIVEATRRSARGIAGGVTEQAGEPIDARIDKYADEAIFAMGQLLPSHFPEADSGDESPDMRMALHYAVETYTKEWLEANAPEVFER